MRAHCLSSALSQLPLSEQRLVLDAPWRALQMFGLSFLFLRVHLPFRRLHRRKRPLLGNRRAYRVNFTPLLVTLHRHWSLNMRAPNSNPSLTLTKGNQDGTNCHPSMFSGSPCRRTWKTFMNPARKDSLKLSHWVKNGVEEKEGGMHMTFIVLGVSLHASYPRVFLQPIQPTIPSLRIHH